MTKRNAAVSVPSVLSRELSIAALILFVLIWVTAAGCASTTATTNDKTEAELTASKTEADVNVDGVFSETAWDEAEEATIKLDAEDGVEAREITLKALYDDKNIYIQASYKDASPKKMNEAWEYDGTKWQKGSYDDTLAFVFDMDGSVKGFADKGMGVMTKPLTRGMDVFDFTLEASADQPSTGCLDFWGW
jgi:hypothetical protein